MIENFIQICAKSSFGFIIRSERTKCLFAALFYGSWSMSMNFLNKIVVSSYNFNYPFFIMTCQMVFTVFILNSLRLFGLISIQKFSIEDCMKFLPASLLFALHSSLSLYAIHGMNIPMYSAIKRCTPLATLFFGIMVLKKPMPSLWIVGAIILITLGCFVASIGDLEFDGQAYGYGLLSVVAQGGYLTLVQRTSLENKLSTTEMVHMNGINTLPLFAIASWCISEPLRISNSTNLNDSGFLFTCLLLMPSGTILTFSQFLCASVCSALTTTLVGVAKSVLQTVIGFFTFGGVKFHPINIIGLSLNMAGGIIYSYMKYKSKDTGQRSKDDTSKLFQDAQKIDIR